MSGRDPAAARFAIITIVRILGVCTIIAGILAHEGRLPVVVPPAAAYVLIALGIVATFILPALLIRKWRTPK